jgi:hypothetical protein
LGRFVTVDPLQFKFSHLTPYNYASNSPVTHLDIDGMQNPEEKNPLSYTVQQGDSPSKIANDFDISVWDLAKMNQGKQEGGGFFNDIGNGNYSDYWVNGVGTNWQMNHGDELIVGFSGKENEMLKDKMSIVPEKYLKPINYISPKSKHTAVMGSASTTVYGWSNIKISTGDNQASGFWETTIQMHDHGFMSGTKGVELLSGSGGKIEFNQNYLDTLHTNSLEKAVENATYLNYGGFQVGFKYTEVTGFDNRSNMNELWKMKLYGFGIGIGFSGSRTYKPDWFSNDSKTSKDSLKKAILNKDYLGEFEQYLIKTYGRFYQDSLIKK